MAVKMAAKAKAKAKTKSTPARATATRKAVSKTKAGPKAKRKTASKSNGFLAALHPSKELAAVIGSSPMPRPEVVSKLWAYIKKHKLQNPKNLREIIADDKLRPVFGKAKVSMFEMNKHLAQHLK